MMKVLIKIVLFILALVLCAARSASPQATDSAPSADEVVTRMMRRDAERRSEMTGYTGLRRYVAVNRDRHAEMEVRVDCTSEGVKQFTVLSEEGSGSIRKHVFSKMLSEESDASRRDTRESSRITPANYEFKMVGQETLDSGPAYILTIAPKTLSKYVINARIWVDATDYSIVRIEGQPARNPSFWVHDVHFIHTYRKVGSFWLASSTRSTSEVRIFGSSELTIESSDYVLNIPNQGAPELDAIASVAR
jgi:hypothetical protein